VSSPSAKDARIFPVTGDILKPVPETIV